MDVPFVETTLSSSLFPLSLEEGETSRSYTLVDSWHAGEGEEGKKRPCKDDFSSLAFVPPGEGIPPTLSTTSYLSNDLEILAEPFFCPSAIQIPNYLRSRRSTFNTGRENTYITFVIGGEDEWLSTVAIGGRRCRHFREHPRIHSIRARWNSFPFSLVQGRLIKGANQNIGLAIGNQSSIRSILIKGDWQIESYYETIIKNYSIVSDDWRSLLQIFIVRYKILNIYFPFATTRWCT